MVYIISARLGRLHSERGPVLKRKKKMKGKEGRKEERKTNKAKQTSRKPLEGSHRWFQWPILLSGIQ